MPDSVYAVLFFAAGAGYFLLKDALESEAGSRALAQGAPPPPSGLARLLHGHFWNFLFTIPLYLWLASGPGKAWGLAPSGEEPALSAWVGAYLVFWLRTAGLTQVLYAAPLARTEPAQAKGVLAGVKLTAALSGLSVFLELYRTPSRSVVGPAAAGLAAIACVLYFLLTVARLRSALRGSSRPASNEAGPPAPPAPRPDR